MISLIAMLDSSDVKRLGARLGFDLVGITGSEKLDKFVKIVEEGGRSGRIPREMKESEPSLRDASASGDPRAIMPEVRSIIVLGSRYLYERQEMKGEPWDPRGRIARHHWTLSYEDLANRRDLMIAEIRSMGYSALWDPRVPVKAAAYRSGVGVYGKNTVIQNEDLGSWVLYTTILTDAELVPDERSEPRCGACQRCIRLCPTKAISEPYVLNSSRCLNYVLASNFPIPLELRELVGDRINGCDDCQEVCPRNESVAPMKGPMAPRFGKWGISPKLLDVLKMEEKDFDDHFASLDWYGPSLRKLKRNAIVALGNTGDCSTILALEPFVLSEDEDLAEHARWAMDAIRKRESERLA